MVSMTNVAFDTLSASKDLQNAGIEARQAEAIALVFKNSQGNLATKSDIELVKADIELVKADIEHLRTEVKADIEHLRTEVKGDIENLRTEVKSDIEQVKGDVRWLKWSIAAMIVVMLGGFGIIISLLP